MLWNPGKSPTRACLLRRETSNEMAIATRRGSEQGMTTGTPPACKGSVEASHAPVYASSLAAASQTASGPQHWTLLHHAASAKDVQQVEQLLRQGFLPDTDGCISPLMLACLGQPANLEDLAEASTPSELSSQIKKATGVGCLATVKALVKGGACPSAGWMAWDPLQLATRGGDLEMVKELLSAGAVPDSHAALCIAITAHRPDILRELLLADPDPCLVWRPHCKTSGNTLLHLAASLKCPESCKLLIQNGPM